jgi:cell division protein FtsL
VLDKLLRSRAWIWLLGISLGGIVFMQVSLLGMNAGIGRAVAQSTELEHQNAALEEQVAELSSGERVRAQAAKLGLLSPSAGDVGFLTARPETDARRAIQRMTAPSDEAREAMANDGRSATAVAVVPTPVPTVAVTPTPAVTAAPTVYATATPAY